MKQFRISQILCQVWLSLPVPPFDKAQDRLRARRVQIRSRRICLLLATGFPLVLFAADYPDGNIPPATQKPETVAPPDESGLTMPVRSPLRQSSGQASGAAHADPLPADLSGQTAIPQLRTDPFQISYFMQQKALAHNQGGAQFTPLQNAQAPTLIMRGIVSGGLALLDVEGHGVYLVREGDTLSLNRQGQNTVIKIEKIDHLSLMVKIGTLNEMIVVR
jgi:hypothetical protein